MLSPSFMKLVKHKEDWSLLQKKKLFYKGLDDVRKTEGEL